MFSAEEEAWAARDNKPMMGDAVPEAKRTAANDDVKERAVGFA